MSAAVCAAPESTLARFDPRHNSLNALRLVLAVLVIASHARPLGGFGPDPRWGDFTVGTWAVAGFFAISGWLIMRSRLSSSLGGYLWRRFLRIYPAFLVCLGVVGFGFAPLGLALGGGSYGVLDGVRYVGGNALLAITQTGVGDTLNAVPYPDAWNGSLWTLFYEALCYLMVGLIVTVVTRRRLPAVMMFGLVGLTAAELAIGAGLPAPYALHLLTMLVPFFFAGGVLFLYRSRIPVTVPLAGLAGALCLLIALTGVNGVLLAVPLAYLCLWLGDRLPLQTLGARNDISYGVYIYAFPVQQILALLDVQRAGLVVFALAAIVCTVPLAALSWFAVERPARRLQLLALRPPPQEGGAGAGSTAPATRSPGTSGSTRAR